MSIFRSAENTSTRKSKLREASPTLARFVAHLVVCLVLTFPLGGVLARHAVPQILLLSVTGEPLGFVGTVLLLLWVLSLLDLWRHVYWDIRQFWALRMADESAPEQPLGETSSEI
jgi:hypothetical protein